MKLRVNIGDKECDLVLTAENGGAAYRIDGAVAADGEVSIEQVRPGVFSLIAGHRSRTVYVTKTSEGHLALAGGKSFALSLFDPRDRSRERKGFSFAGPLEIKASMPGKVIQVLTKVGEQIEAGSGVMMIEAMKMQNEVKTSKGGQVTKVCVAPGQAVAPGDILIVVE
jgi:biotin carboxyl carrier protein